MPRSEAAKRARNRYEKKNRRLVVTLYPADKPIADHIAKLEAEGIGYSEYIRGLIFKDIANSKRYNSNESERP